MAPFRFCEYFGQALHAARTGAGLEKSSVAGPLKVDGSTVWRWETGRNWPEDPDRVVAVYSNETGTTQTEIWEDMVRRAREAEVEFIPGSPRIDESGEPEGERRHWRPEDD